MLTLLSSATVLGIAAFVVALVGFLANALQVREGIAKMFGGGAGNGGGPTTTTNIFHSRGNMGEVIAAGALGDGVALAAEEILRHANVLHSVGGIIGDVGAEIPDIGPIDDLASVGGDILSGLFDLKDLMR